MNQTREHSLIQGNILKSLISFAFPVLLALFLQAMYGAADLIIVGQFADTFEQSGVASGSQLFNMITMVITGLSMGVTVFVGDCIGAGKPEKAGKGIGTGIAIFAVLAVVVTAFVVPFSDTLASFMHAPAEAFSQTSGYVRICGIGTVFIIAYNVIGAVFAALAIPKHHFLRLPLPVPSIFLEICCWWRFLAWAPPELPLQPYLLRGSAWYFPFTLLAKRACPLLFLKNTFGLIRLA